MRATGLFVIDSDVLITAKNRYYAFDLCPGFWQWLARQHQAERVGSIDRVRLELLLGHETDALVHWVTKVIPQTFFRTVDAPTAAKFAEVMTWAQHQPNFLEQAKAKFRKVSTSLRQPASEI